MTDDRRNIFDFDLNELEALLASWGEPAYRAGQVWQGLYKQLWSSPAEFTPLSKTLRSRLASELDFESLTPIKSWQSEDRRTTKTAFRLRNDHLIEAVLMRYDRRQTVCISTQAGCAMGCVFCATGQMGLMANLTAGEIVSQVVHFQRLIAEEGSRITNIVFMGMGEPFHNYVATLKAADLLNSPQGLHFGARRMTISTVGLVPKIKQFTRERRQINLAVSLHAADDDLRSSMLPINDRYPIEPLIAACREYVQATGRRITFEWALIEGVNDDIVQAGRLIQLLDGLLCHVNVIPLNPTPGYDGKASRGRSAEAFCKQLRSGGVPCTLRIRRGIDIQAGCGQLIQLSPELNPDYGGVEESKTG